MHKHGHPDQTHGSDVYKHGSDIPGTQKQYVIGNAQGEIGFTFIHNSVRNLSQFIMLPLSIIIQ